MKPEAQRIAIAEACGWKWSAPFDSLKQNDLVSPNGDSMVRLWPDGRLGVILANHQGLSLPSYLTDLNAMHEAEKVLTDADQKHKYASLIGRHDYWGLLHATAAQRAEAFLRTLSLWRDTK